MTSLKSLFAVEASDLPKVERAELDPKTLFTGINTSQPVIVAVSGGSDSIALLHLASVWSKLKSVELFAVTVDHGLRPEAAAEAAFVAGVCESLEVTHVTLAWEGLKPNSGMSESSRKARYTLLEEFAGEVGARTILCGHTADDQAETVYMRLKREKDVGVSRGLSGMARITLLSGGVRLVRPLLGTERQQLRDFLISQSQGWIEDPTNLDMAYERVQVRAVLAKDEEYRSQLASYATVMAERRVKLAEEAAQELGRRVNVKPGLVYSLNTEYLLMLKKEVYLHVLQVLLATVGGADYLPGANKLAPLVEAIRFSNQSTPRQRLTLTGCVVEVTAKSIRLYRECRNLKGNVIAPGTSMFWDGRLFVSNRSGASVYVGPFDPTLKAETEEKTGIILTVSPKVALSSMPIMRVEDGGLFLPTYGQRILPPAITARITCEAIENFCPEYDFALLEWLRELDLLASDVESRASE